MVDASQLQPARLLGRDRAGHVFDEMNGNGAVPEKKKNQIPNPTMAIPALTTSTPSSGAWP